MTERDVDNKRDRVIKEIIEALGEVALGGGETLGYRTGPAPSLDIRTAALRSLASYVPHPDAVKVLTKILRDNRYGNELRQVAAEALHKK